MKSISCRLCRYPRDERGKVALASTFSTNGISAFQPPFLGSSISPAENRPRASVDQCEAVVGRVRRLKGGQKAARVKAAMG